MSDAPKVARKIPRYTCHKEVWALKIKAIERHGVSGKLQAGATITPEESGVEPFEVDFAYLHKHDPQVGGYFVLYEDGYASFSPAKVFEAGYTRIEQ